MKASELVADLERRAKAAGLSLEDICRRVDIHPATFYRWKSGESIPGWERLNSLQNVVAEAERAIA